MLQTAIAFPAELDDASQAAILAAVAHPLWNYALLKAQLIVLDARRGRMSERERLRQTLELTTAWAALDRAGRSSVMQSTAWQAMDDVAATLGVVGRDRASRAFGVLREVQRWSNRIPMLARPLVVNAQACVGGAA